VIVVVGVLVVVLAVGAAEILHIGNSHSKAAALCLAQKELGVTNAASIDYLCEMVD
jgi:hypothetical protein